jgi:tripartite-type tricarboxylate transporter receptor subunit TctC
MPDTGGSEAMHRRNGSRTANDLRSEEEMTMRTPLARRVARIVALALLAACAGLVQAQSYPTKPIKLIVPWPPGGGVDTSARLISEPLAQRLGQAIVVENRPGAAGNIGTAMIKQEKPDGYTLLMGSLSPHAVNPHLYDNLGFDPIKDFAPVALVYTVPSFLVVPASSPVNTPQELVNLAKSKPGKLNFGSGGAGSSQHLFAVMFNTSTKIDSVHVGYKGTSPAEAALVAGQVDYMLDPPTCLPFVQAGRLKALAVAAPKRSTAMPNVPTLDELGIQNVHTLTYYGVLAPANTPKEIVNKLNAEINAILKSDDMRARLAKLAAEPGTGTPDDFGKFMEAELKRYGEIVRISGAKGVQ